MGIGDIGIASRPQSESISTKFGVFTRPVNETSKIPAVLIVTGVFDSDAFEHHLLADLAEAFASVGFASFATVIRKRVGLDLSQLAPINVQSPISVEPAWAGVVGIGEAGAIAAELARERKSGGTVMISYLPDVARPECKPHQALVASRGPILFLNAVINERFASVTNAYCHTLHQAGVQATCVEISETTKKVELRRCVTFNSVAWLTGARQAQRQSISKRIDVN